MLKHIPFYASLLDKDIGENKKSTNRHVLVYGAVEAHGYGKHGCIASNATLGEETGLNDRVVSNTLSELKKAGWVAFNLDDCFRRGEIVPLLTIEVPKTPYIKDTTPPTSNVLHRKQLEYSIDRNSKTVSGLKATKIKPKKNIEELKDPKSRSIIALFEKVDINYKVLYDRKMEHTAVFKLLEVHTAKEIDNVLSKAVLYNKLPYVNSKDKIYKPSDLLKNWQKLTDKEAELHIQPKMEVQQKAGNRIVW